MTAPHLRLTIRRGSEADPRCISFDDARVTVGRSEQAEIRLPYSVVSSHHLTFERRGQRYVVRDEGSTNGTALDGDILAPGRWYPLSESATLQIVDVFIDVELHRREVVDVDGFTMAETGTLARELLGEVLPDDDLAYFELLEGPERGRRFELPDEVDGAAIGGSPEALVTLPGEEIPQRVATVSFEEDAFRLRSAEGARVVHGGEPITEATPLRDGEHIEAAGVSLRFSDPLESELEKLDELDDGEPSGEDRSGREPVDSPSPGESSGERDSPQTERDSGDADERPGKGVEREPGGEGDDERRESRGETTAVGGWLEVVLLAVTILLIAAVVAILAVTFNLV